MKTLFVLYVLGAILSFFLCTGWQLAYFQNKYPKNRDAREDLGYAIIVGAASTPFWPFTMPLNFCLSGFAEYGWTLIPKDSVKDN